MSKKYQPEKAYSAVKVNRIVNPEGSSNDQSNQLTAIIKSKSESTKPISNKTI